MEQVNGGDSCRSRGERGSTAVEYALLVAAAAAGSILMAAVLGDVIDWYLAMAATEMGGSGVSGP